MVRRALMSGGRKSFLRAPSKLPFFRKKGYGKSPVKLEDGVWQERKSQRLKYYFGKWEGKKFHFSEHSF